MWWLGFKAYTRGYINRNAAYCSLLQYTAAYCSILQHTAAGCCILAANHETQKNCFVMSDTHWIVMIQISIKKNEKRFKFDTVAATLCSIPAIFEVHSENPGLKWLISCFWKFFFFFLPAFLGFSSLHCFFLLLVDLLFLKAFLLVHHCITGNSRCSFTYIQCWL